MPKKRLQTVKVTSEVTQKVTTRYGKTWNCPVRRHVLHLEGQRRDNSEFQEDKFPACRDQTCANPCGKCHHFDTTREIAGERGDILHKILKSEGFFSQMETSKREKPKDYKVLEETICIIATYIQRVAKGHVVGLAAEVRKAIPGEKIYRTFDDYLGIVQAVASMEYWEEKYLLSRMYQEIQHVGSSFNLELNKALEKVKLCNV